MSEPIYLLDFRRMVVEKIEDPDESGMILAMNLQGVRVGDIVRVDKRGRRFLAEVQEKESGRLTIKPLQSGINYFEASAREVVEHYKKMGQRA